MTIYVEVITLIKTIEVTNEYGGLEYIPIKREVFARKKSVGMKETYQAAAVGFRPDIVFVLFDYSDYQDEEFVEFDSKVYSVIRTFQKEEDNEIELICQHHVNNAEVYNYANA